MIYFALPKMTAEILASSSAMVQDRPVKGTLLRKKYLIWKVQSSKYSLEHVHCSFLPRLVAH